jgi:hypothetical protein
MDLHGWSDAAERLSFHAAHGEWTEMPMLITDEMLDEFCVVTDEASLADELKKRYGGIADRLTLYSPFVPRRGMGGGRGWLRISKFLTQSQKSI